MWITDEIGETLTAWGGLYIVFGLFELFNLFDGNSLALGNILCLCGLTLRNAKKTFRFFVRKQKIPGTLCFFAGVLLVFSRWTSIGFFVEIFGFLSLVYDFFPVPLTFAGERGSRDAVQCGHALPCLECGNQSQAIGDLSPESSGTLEKLTEPRLRELHILDPTVASLVGKFNYRWNSDQSVSIKKVYEIILPPNIKETREVYRSKLAAVETPRQIQTFNSTQCLCDLGTNEIKFCTSGTCEMCTAIKSAFTAFESGNKPYSGRFGPGVYSYLKPSWADQWAESTPGSPYLRLMLACEVNLLSAQVKPPESSGILQSREEGPLVFVSGAEAITPKYLIVYSKIDLPSLPLPPLYDIPYLILYPYLLFVMLSPLKLIVS